MGACDPIRCHDHDESIFILQNSHRQDVSEQDRTRFARDVGLAVLDELAATAEASGLLSAMGRFGFTNMLCNAVILPAWMIYFVIFPMTTWEDFWVALCISVVMISVAMFGIHGLNAALNKAASGTVAAKCTELAARFPGTQWTPYS